LSVLLGSRALLVYDRPDALKTWLKCWLSAGSAKLIVAECASALSADEALERKANVAYRELALRRSAVKIGKRVATVLDRAPSYGQLWRASAALIEARSGLAPAISRGHRNNTGERF
jgi:hypothetical protein